MLDAYCKYKRFDFENAGLKWYGLALDIHKNPLDYGK